MKKMLIDATHAEETRVAVIDNDCRLIEYDYESAARRPLKGNIFLAKVTRVEPSLQAAFVNFGGNRHGFLPFSEIHPDYFRIPVADKQAILDEQKREMEERRAAEEEEEAEEEARLLALQEARNKASEETANEEEVTELSGAEELISTDTPQPDVAPEAFEEPEEDEAEEGEDAQVSEEAAEESDDEDDGDEDESDDELVAEGNTEDGDEAVGEVAEGAEGSTEEGAEGENEGENNGRRRRGGRGRWRGRDNRRGGGGRGGRSSFHSRRVEMVGGDGVEGDQVYRPSLRKHYKIQEVIKRGQIMLVQIVKEERGNKGAAVTTYLSLPGRYCVLMPNSPRAGGVSRKIANFEERRRMRHLLRELEVPDGMSTIVRTAGMSRDKQEIKRDLDYLMRLWDTIRELTLKSTAPSLVYEEGDLIKKAIRDIYGPEIEEIMVSGKDGYDEAKNFMKLLMPSNVKDVKDYKDERLPLFHKYKVESQIVDISESTVRLRSGGYLVINPTEALVSIDVNSGRATKERHIEETALKTNLEAASEVARQLKLRDLGGLVVIDFIDMEDFRNNGKVERRLRDALSNDRARIQVGRISSFGLLELSRQRLNPSLTESQFQKCEYCEGSGHTRTVDAAAVIALRALEAEALKSSAIRQLVLTLPSATAVYILNHKKAMLTDIEKRFDFKVLIQVDEDFAPDGYEINVSAMKQNDEDDEEGASQRRPVRQPRNYSNNAEEQDAGDKAEEAQEAQPAYAGDDAEEDEDDVMPEDNSGNVERELRDGGRGGRNRNRGGRNRNRNNNRRGGRGGKGGFRGDREGNSNGNGNGGGDDFSQMLDETVSDFRPQQQSQQQAQSAPAQDKPKVAAKYFTSRRSASASVADTPPPVADEPAPANDGADGDPKKSGWWNKILD
ncbi:MAG: Rne/Rng family ribonuclease [Alphaproteobacteria bacterium]|nr:Rne/Rng family ribonuclease [Alphaproteobacteria bacterium]